MAEALRSILAEFTVVVDPTNALAKGHAQVDALKAKMGSVGPLRIPAPKLPAGGLGQFGAAFKDGFNAPGAGLGRMVSGINLLKASLVGLAGSAVVGGAVSIVNSLGDIGESAARLGVTTDEFQRLDVLAKQNATSVGALGTAFRGLAQNAVNPSKDAAAAFQALGVTTKQQDGTFKSRQDLFFETAGALADIGDETQRAALAQQLYGRSATELLPLLSQGRAGIEAQREQLAGMAVVSGDAIKAADELADRWVAMRMQLLAVGEPVIKRVLIPLLSTATDLLLASADAAGKFTKQVSPLRVGLVAGAVALSRWVGPITALTSAGFGKTLAGWAGQGAKAALQFAKIAGAFLLIEDVVGFFQGKDSLTGDLLKKIFGDDEGAKIQQAATDIAAAFESMWMWITGRGQGEAAVKLLSELTEAAVTAANVLGFDFATGKDVNATNDAVARIQAENAALASDNAVQRGNLDLGGNIPLAAGQYGPGLPPGFAANVTVGDTVVNVSGVNPNDAPAVARAVGAELGRSRAAVIAPYQGLSR